MIKNKKQFYELWYAGKLGNKPKTWETWREARIAGVNHVGMRSIVIGGPCFYHVDIDDVAKYAWDYRMWPKEFTYSESMSDETLLIQGEVTRNERGLELTFRLKPGITMREAMKHPIRVTGLQAKMLLQGRLWPDSYEELMSLLDEYPDHVIEFGAHDHTVGVLPNRNMVVWEVRAY